MGTKRDLIKEKSRSVYKMVWANMQQIKKNRVQYDDELQVQGTRSRKWNKDRKWSLKVGHNRCLSYSKAKTYIEYN